MLTEAIDVTVESPALGRRAQSRVAGLLASLWTRRLAITLDIAEPARLELEVAARHITARNFRATLRPSASALVERYRSSNADDVMVGVLRVAETFAIGSMQPWAAPRATIAFMRNDAAFYPAVVVEALEQCVGIGKKTNVSYLRPISAR